MSDQFSSSTSEATRLCQLAVAIGAGALLAACSPAETADDMAEPLATADAQTESSLDAAADDGLIETSFGLVDIEEVTNPDAVHAEPGRLHVSYLSSDGTTLADFPEAVVMGSWGAMGDWSVRSDLGEYPVIVAEGGGTWQGYTCSWTSLTELAPDGPREVLNYLDYYSNAGAGRDPLEEFSSTLEGPGADNSLVVRYEGTTTATVTYQRKGDAYELVSGEQPTGC